MRSGKRCVAASYTVINEEIKDKGNARGNGLTIYYTNDTQTMRVFGTKEAGGQTAKHHVNVISPSSK